MFLDVFAVVAFIAGEAEQALFEDGVPTVPEGQGETDALMAVADAGEAVLIPAIGAGARVIVGKIFPGGAVAAIVFADSAPGAFAEERPPAAPVCVALAGLLHASMFFGDGAGRHQTTIIRQWGMV